MLKAFESFKVTHREPVDVDFLYDIGIEGTHSFVLQNGIVANNCFNKCLSGDTLVSAPQGERRLETIQSGDVVYCYVNGRLIETRVVNRVLAGTQAIFDLSFEGGRLVEATMDHRFVCTDGGVREVWELFSRDIEVQTSDGGGCRLIGVANRRFAPTYTLHVEHPVHNYVLSNGLVSKNSHAVSYSFLTYISAFLKANYPEEFFCALMSVRSQTMNPKLWAVRAASYANEAALLGVKIYGPSLNFSDINFSIRKGAVLFGLGAIKNIGPAAAKGIISARRNKPFVDVYDFLERVNLSEVNTQVFESLVNAGAFDSLGYQRKELLEHSHALYDYVKSVYDMEARRQENLARETYNAEVEPLIEKRKLLQSIQKKKTARELTLEEQSFLEETTGLRKKSLLKEKPLPEKVTFNRKSDLVLDIKEIITQAKYIGCFLQVNPATICFPQVRSLDSVELDESVEVAGVVASCKVINTRNGGKMAFLEIVDDTAIAEVVVFQSTFESLAFAPEEWDVVKVYGKVEAIEPTRKLKAFKLEIRKY